MLLKVSPSQISASRTCLRKWHGIYVGGEREPDTDATSRGKDIHKIIEDYLNGKGPIDTTSHYGRIAASGLKFLPQPKTVTTEGDFEMPGNGWTYHGFIDMVKPYYVGDHKTTSDITKYAKDEETLRDDPQVILYGTRSMVYGVGDVDIQWIYYRANKQPKGPYQAKQTRFTYRGADLCAAKAKLDQEVSDILGRRHLKMLDLPPTESACFKYNKPCHLRRYCTDLKPTIGALMSQSRDDLLANLKAKALGAANPAGVAMPPPAPVATPPAAPAPGLPALPGLPPIAPPGAPAAAAPPAAPAPGLPPLTPPTAAAGPSLPPLPGAAPAPVATPPAAPAPGLPPLPGVAPLAAPPAPTQPSLPNIDPAVMAAAAAEANAKSKPKAPALPPPPGPATPPAPAPAPAGAPIQLADGLSIGVLYVDCMPLGRGVKHFSEVAKLCHEGIRETTGLAHYKMGDFGKGLGLWVEAVKLFLGADPVKELYVDTTANDGKDALEALMGMAASVIRGVK